MRIPCPYCGLRDHSEFTYGGDVNPVRPDPEDENVEAWNAFVYERANPKGAHGEFWHHAQGCRLWLRVEHDTVTHQIGNVEIVGPWGPDSGGPDSGGPDSGEDKP